MKKMMRKGLLLFVAVFALVACSNDDGTVTEEDKETPLTLLTGGRSGVYYPLGEQLSERWQEELGLRVEVVESNATADNLRAIEEGEADIAFAQTDVAMYAADGVNAFASGALENVRALGALYPETIQLVTLQSSNIQSIEDLTGKTISVGAPNSGTHISAEHMLNVYGIPVEEVDIQYLDFSQSVEGLRDGSIDVAFITAGMPTLAVEQLRETDDIRLLSLEKSKIEALVAKYPHYMARTIEAGTYGLEEEVQTVSVMAMLVVSKQLSNDVVYALTKTLYEQAPTLSHEKAKWIDVQSGRDGIDIPLHRGAQKYFEEREK